VNRLRLGIVRLELMQQRIGQDLLYINNMSIIFDLKIAVRNCFGLTRPRNVD
jgi:hypothetical protein